MTGGLKPYDSYKDSGVPWLGQVPAHWDVLRQRNAVQMLVSNIDKHSVEGEVPVRLCNYVDVYKNDRITDSLSFMRATATKDEVEQFRLQSGDVIITKDSESWNDIGVPALVEYEATDLVCGYHLAILRPRKGVLNGSYLLRALQSRGVAVQYHVSANGVTRYGLSHDAIKSILLPIPSLPEQTAIARFLDHVDKRIRRYIRAKRRLIELLHEQKQAIILNAVTQGLDPSTPQKPSRIPWLDSVPQHWEVTTLQRYWQVTDCKHLAVPFVDEGIPIASVVEVQSFTLNLTQCKRTTPEWYRNLIEGGRRPKRGDLIYCRNASVGACALIETDMDIAMGQDVCLISSQSQNQRFLNYLLHSTFIKTQLEGFMVGSTFKRINISEINTLTVLVPPKAEQDSICEWLDSRLAVHDDVIQSAEHEIKLMREYRTRLIADVVTGKLDVRAAAAALPQETQADSELELNDAEPEAEAGDNTEETDTPPNGE
jgi:type I restriction enzyme, S subunit